MNFRNWKLLTSVVLFTTTCSITTTASAFLAGTRAPGMGSTGIAYPQDAFAGAYNPAGILEVENRFDLSTACIFSHGTVDIQLDRTNANEEKKKVNGKFNPFNSPFSFDLGVGFNQTFCTNICGYSWEWAVGLVAYNREKQKTSFSKHVPLLNSKESKSKLGMKYIHDVVSPILSLRLTECHTVGVSFDYHIQCLGIKGLEYFHHATHSYSPSHVTNNGDSYSRGFGATIGWSWKAMDGLTLGAVYRSKTKMSRLHKYKGFLAQRGAVDSPAQWGIGAAYQFLPCATVTADIEWIKWDQIKSLHNPLSHNKKTDLAGRDHGPGFGFNNQVVYRLGIDYAFNQFWTVRAGYRYANSVTKKSEAMLNMLFCKVGESVGTLGISYMLTPKNEISFFYAHSFENEVHGKHAIPKELGSGDVSLTESKDFVGLAWAFIY